MPLRIPGDVRAAIIREWLNGKPRDTIARDNSSSTGSVSNIINDWRNDLTVPLADALRELGIMLRKSRITASQCALGFRLASIMKDLGVDEDTFGEFISEIYNHCKNIGLKPEYIAYSTKQILDLSGSIEFSQLPDYIQEKTNEKRKLEENITRLRNEELDAKASLHQALTEKKISLADLEQFSLLKIELSNLGIPVIDVQHFVRIIHGVRQLGHSVDSIARVVSNWEAAYAIQAQLEKNIRDLCVNEWHLQEECDRWDRLTSVHRQKLLAYEQLKNMGLGLKELKMLFDTITEVSVENKISGQLAVQKFFADIEKNYDNKLGYDSTVERLKSEIQGIKSEIDKQNKELSVLQKALASNNKVARVLGELILMGFDDQQIIDLAWTLRSYSSNKDALEEDLIKYGSLNNVIAGLNQQVGELENRKKVMKVERDSLDVPKSEVVEVWEMQESALFAPLTMARGEPVEVNQLKHAVTGCIDLALERLGSDHQASAVFKKAREIINAPYTKWLGFNDGLVV
ncbi:MAG TPA: hypothetical protein VFI73_04095 [Candidatus Nitrosopolaris sp.]|nr:hypothetical protein [Candidatus Nitrosopolaris sp.]